MAEPKLEVLPFAQFSTGQAQFCYLNKDTRRDGIIRNATDLLSDDKKVVQYTESGQDYLKTEIYLHFI